MTSGDAMLKLPYVYEQDGRFYFRKVRRVGTKPNGKPKLKTRLHRLPDPGDPRFITEYQKYLEDNPPTRHLPGSIAELCTLYRGSAEFGRLAPSTRRNRLHYLGLIEEKHGKKRYADLTRGKVKEIRDELQDTPGTADHMIMALSVLFSFAVDRELVKQNPCARIERLSTGEYEPWPPEVYEKAIALASPMLALAIDTHLYTGQRISDVCRMQWGHIKDNRIAVTQQKTGKEVWIPLHQDLIARLATVERKSVFLLYNRYGQPFTPDALRERLRLLMSKIGEDYNYHGLRKNAVNALLEAGATTFEVMSITGHTPQMLEHYAKRVQVRDLASAAILKWEGKKR